MDIPTLNLDKLADHIQNAEDNHNLSSVVRSWIHCNVWPNPPQWYVDNAITSLKEENTI